MTVAHDPAPRLQKSFRDPGGTLIHHNGRILRAVYPHARRDLEAFLESTVAREAMDAGTLVRSLRIAASEFPELDADCVVEHEKIPFASYPYEWPPEMLHAAGALTIALARRVAAEGFGLKDATPYNVLFRGSDPVFVDVLSFERRDPQDSRWIAYGQFVRTFLLPLLAVRHFGMTLDRTLAGARDGLEPETVYRWMGAFERLRPLFLGLVSIPTWLKGREKPASYRGDRTSSAEKAQFVLDGILKSCERSLRKLEPRASDSAWSGYLDQKSLYSPQQLAEKEVFVTEALGEARPQTVLDVGANEGHFSLLAARSGASVVAIDSDPAVVGSIWRKVNPERADVLPLVVDLTRPTPAIGWRNQECASFLDRARGHFDMVMMLAVLHHILVTERIPIDEVLTLASEISREYLLIEFVAPDDPMFERIVRGREKLYSHMTKAWFEAAAAERFDVVRTQRIDGLNRWLYLLRRRRTTD